MKSEPSEKIIMRNQTNILKKTTELKKKILFFPNSAVATMMGSRDGGKVKCFKFAFSEHSCDAIIRQIRKKLKVLLDEKFLTR